MGLVLFLCSHAGRLNPDQQEKPLGGVALMHQGRVPGQALEIGQGADVLEDFFRQGAEQMMPAQG